MKVYNKRGCISLAILGLFVLGGFVVLYVNYKSVTRQLRAEHVKGVRLIREYWSKEPIRPVLRGVALPGNGGLKLAEILVVIESERPNQPRIPIGFRQWWKLGGDSDEAAYAYGRKFLPDVREALQHEYCRLPFDYVGPDKPDNSSLRWRIMNQVMFLDGLLLQSARRRASQGDYVAALQDVTDSIRLVYDLGRGTGLNFFHTTQQGGLFAAIEMVAQLLHEHPFPPEALEKFLAEVRVLRSTRPAVDIGSVVAEYGRIISLSQFIEGHLTGQTGHDMVAGTAVSVEVLKKGGLRLKEYHESWEEYRRIVGLEYAEAEAQAPKYLEMSIEQAENFISGSPDPLGTKESDLRDEMLFACLEAAVLAHLCRARNDGVWPETLAGCGEIPLDPWDGAPLRYRPPANGLPAIIYSVSTDWRDDGGEVESPMNGGEKNPDFVFPLGPWPEPEEGDDE